MKDFSLQKKIVILIILLAILFNIGRIAIDQESYVVMSSFVYLLAFVGVLLPFVIHINGKAGSEVFVLAMIGLYFFCSSVLHLGHSLWGVNTYLSITELLLLTAIVNLTQALALEVRQLLQQSELFLATEQSVACPTLEQDRAKLEVEMVRCRRYGRNLGIILIEPQKPVPTDQDVSPQLHPVISNCLLMRAIGHFLLQHLRRPDWILNDVARNRFMIVCPESTITDLENTTNRLNTSLQLQLNILVKHGYATFPDDAVTSEGLILTAQNRFQVSTIDDDPLANQTLSQAAGALEVSH
jgi:hypothetical protein